jgi:hypothetical protein
MDILFYVVISGLAVAFTTEFISELFGKARLIRLLLTLPLAYGACWLFGISWQQSIVCALAASFISTFLLQLVDKATTIQNKYTRRY